MMPSYPYPKASTGVWWRYEKTWMCDWGVQKRKQLRTMPGDHFLLAFSIPDFAQYGAWNGQEWCADIKLRVVILFFGCGMFPLICAVSKVRHGGLFSLRWLNPRVYLYLHSCSGVILFFGCGMFPLICVVSKVRHRGLFFLRWLKPPPLGG